MGRDRRLSFCSDMIFSEKPVFRFWPGGITR
jgi:hypothetical protein